jgi:hypothetical protein
LHQAGFDLISRAEIRLGIGIADENVPLLPIGGTFFALGGNLRAEHYASIRHHRGHTELADFSTARRAHSHRGYLHRATGAVTGPKRLRVSDAGAAAHAFEGKRYRMSIET